MPEGYDESQRDVPGGFTAEPDIMDTWATSSLTPQIVTRWEEPDEASKALFKATFPMDLRPQGQDIIRTWLFSTVDRAHLENKCLPWAHATLSGWILDPDHKKMSKSKATSSCRTSRSSSSRRRGALLGRRGPSRPRRHV